MHVRHTNRARCDLQSNRLRPDTLPEIDGFEVPTVKLGRYVQFEAGSDFSDYLDDLCNQGDNRHGIKKGWFDIVEGPLFVEYADLTEGLATMLRTRVRPRSFIRELDKVTGSLTDGLRGATAAHAEHTDALNLARRHAVAVALETGDHDEAMKETPWLYEEASSRWGASIFRLMKQPKLVKNPDTPTTSYTYGFPLFQDTEDQLVRNDIVQLIRDQRLLVPGELLTGKRPVVPALELHRELSGMRGLEPTLPEPPPVQLGPLELHRF